MNISDFIIELRDTIEKLIAEMSYEDIKKIKEKYNTEDKEK